MIRKHFEWPTAETVAAVVVVVADDARSDRHLVEGYAPLSRPRGQLILDSEARNP